MKVDERLLIALRHEFPPVDAKRWHYDGCVSRDGWRYALTPARREISLGGHQGPKRNLIQVIIAAERVLA